jgi:hypothetical protein
MNLPPVKLIASLMVAGIAASAQAQTKLITFDDLTDNGSGTPIANGYAGLEWNYFGVVNGLTVNGVNGYTGSGYHNGVVSQDNVAYNVNGGLALFYVNTGAFNLNSAYLTAAWNDGLHVEVLGYVGDTVTYDNIYTVNTGGPTLINFNLPGVDEVDFESYGGLQNFGFNGNGDQFAMDNLSITLVPEPTTLALTSLSGFVAMFVARRRK